MRHMPPLWARLALVTAPIWIGYFLGWLLCKILR